MEIEGNKILKMTAISDLGVAVHLLQQPGKTIGSNVSNRTKFPSS